MRRKPRAARRPTPKDVQRALHFLKMLTGQTARHSRKIDTGARDELEHDRAHHRDHDEHHDRV